MPNGQTIPEQAHTGLSAAALQIEYGRLALQSYLWQGSVRKIVQHFYPNSLYARYTVIIKFKYMTPTKPKNEELKQQLAVQLLL